MVLRDQFYAKTRNRWHVLAFYAGIRAHQGVVFEGINSNLTAWKRAAGLAESHCLFAVQAMCFFGQQRRQFQGPRQWRAKNQSAVCCPNRLSCQRLPRVLGRPARSTDEVISALAEIHFGEKGPCALEMSA